MNRVLKLVIAVATVSVASVATVAAQSVSFGVGGGLIAPLSDYKDVDKAGWHVAANVAFAIPLSPVGVRVDGLYGQTTHKDFAGSPVDGKTRLIGGLASVVWNIPVSAPLVKPYVLAGGGFYNVKITAPSEVPPVDSSESKFAYGVGAGVNVGVGPVHFFAEGRYVSVRSSVHRTFVPLTAGVTFGAK
jgi:opacity protein-like surface antigen